MAATAPMRDGPPAGSGTGGDSRVTTTSASSAAAATTTNFEYDDNEWDIGIGNLIIDLDADIEKTNEKSNVGNLTSGSSGSMAAASATNAAGGGSSSSSSSNSSSNSNSSSSSSSSGKTNKSTSSSNGSGPVSGGGSGGSVPPTSVEHSSAGESNKSLKMKIKRTKSGGKSSEKHEIVKPNEQNGGEAAAAAAALCNSNEVKGSSASGKHSSISGVSGSVNSNVNSTNVAGSAGSNCGSAASASVNSVSNKRGGSSHRRDKTKDKHPLSGDKAVGKSSTLANQSSSINQSAAAAVISGSAGGSAIGAADLNGIVRTPVQRMFPIQTNGPGPPSAGPGPPPSPSKEQASKPASVASAFTSNAIPTTCATPQTSSAQVTATPVATNPVACGNLNQCASVATATSAVAAVENGNSSSAGVNSAAGNAGASAANVYISSMDDVSPRPPSPTSPPCKKIKTANCLINDSKETKDACVGTSVSTMTEPDCLGPCEPGTSVTLEGIVWHETEGVLVVNVTWRGKTYVGTLLDCTRHDWAPPRFCDSPTSDLDARLPKGRAKRGRAATNDLSNFTETRSSVHSKLRSSSNGSSKGARKGLSNSPTPFVSPRPDSGSSKRKSRPSEEDSASPQANSKKSKPSSQTTPPSPPSSPVFFECPEANCCKKYKHINGLKYHQSHAHGGPCAGDDDDATKESGSMSENEEMPSPADQQSIKSERKDENSESEPATPISESVPVSLNLPSSPHPQPSVAAVSLITELEPVPVEPSPPLVDNKTVVKPGVLRFGVPAGIEDISVTQPTTSAVTAKPPSTTTVAGIRPVTTSVSTLPGSLPLTMSAAVVSQPHCLPSPSPPSIPQQIPLSPSQTTTSAGLPHAFSSSAQQLQPTQSVQSLPLNPTPAAKLPQFKVKPASVLLQDDKVKDKSKCQVQRKKSRKSPGGSPHSHPMEQSQYKVENAGREEVRSPAYSDISDDGAPVLEAEISDPKNKPLPMDKKSLESSGAHSPHAMQHFNMYPFYGQPPFLVPSVQPEAKSKEEKAQESKLSDKEKKDSEMPQKLLPTHFYPYDYVSNYNYNLTQNYPIAMVSSNSEKEIKEESKSPGPTDLVKPPASNVHASPGAAQYQSSMSKSKSDSSNKMPSEPYGGMKDSAEARSPLNASSYLLARQQQQQHQQQQQQQQQHQQQQQLQQMQQMQQMQSHSQHHAAQVQQQQQLQQQQQQQQMQQQMLQQQQVQQQQLQAQAQHQLSQAHQQQQQQEEMRRYYSGMYPDQRRKEPQHTSHSEAPLKATPPPNSMNSKSSMSMSGGKHKDKQMSDEKKDEKVKQEGVKPTMETQGPPPPPTSSYAYFHPSSYLQSPYVPFDPAHPMYRTMNPMIVPAGPYGNSPYLHHPPQMHTQIPRYHAPEDLSRPPSGSATKALDLLQHQASQYYSSPSHKIHELQERAIKSPTPKVASMNASPSAAANGQPPSLSTPQLTPTSTSDRLSGSGSSQSTKASSVDGKDSRSPPPQRHVHTHHHTHVGLGYPILGAQYAAPYGAAVLASEQAAAVASAGSNPYSPK